MTNINLGISSYDNDKCISFRKTREEYGEFSNMCSGYPILVGTHRFITSEHLYQAFRFSDGKIQEIIQKEKSPMSAKMKSKKYIDQTREDWYDLRVDVMDWCLRLKLYWSWKKFGGALLDTGDQDIVENSHKDRFWGCVLDDNDVFIGKNVLGKLLMNLRDELRTGEIDKDNLNLPVIKDMVLFDESVEDHMELLAEARRKQKK